MGVQRTGGRGLDPERLDVLMSWLRVERATALARASRLLGDSRDFESGDAQYDSRVIALDDVLAAIKHVRQEDES